MNNAIFILNDYQHTYIAKLQHTNFQNSQTMSTTMQLRFQKVDQYKNSIFIVGTNKPEEKDAFDRLTKFHEALKNQNISTFLPLYSTPEYATIRFKPNTKFKFVEGNTYELEFNIRKKTYEGKEYVSCFVNKSKLISKAALVDYGELMTLE